MNTNHSYLKYSSPSVSHSFSDVNHPSKKTNPVRKDIAQGKSVGFSYQTKSVWQSKINYKIWKDRIKSCGGNISICLKFINIFRMKKYFLCDMGKLIP